MAFLRLASLLALSAWVGGLAVIGGLAAPAIFATLAGRDPAGGRALAAIVFGVVFDRFQQLAWVLGGLLLLLLVVRAMLGPRPRRLGLRMWTVTGMLAMSLVSVFVVAPRIEAIRAELNGNVADLPAGDARRIEFGRLHGASSALMLLTLAAGVGLFWAEMKDQ